MVVKRGYVRLADRDPRNLAPPPVACCSDSSPLHHPGSKDQGFSLVFGAQVRSLAWLGNRWKCWSLANVLNTHFAFLTKGFFF